MALTDDRKAPRDRVPRRSRNALVLAAAALAAGGTAAGLALGLSGGSSYPAYAQVIRPGTAFLRHPGGDGRVEGEREHRPR